MPRRGSCSCSRCTARMTTKTRRGKKRHTGQDGVSGFASLRRVLCRFPSSLSLSSRRQKKKDLAASSHLRAWSPSLNTPEFARSRSKVTVDKHIRNMRRRSARLAVLFPKGDHQRRQPCRCAQTCSGKEAKALWLKVCVCVCEKKTYECVASRSIGNMCQGTLTRPQRQSEWTSPSLPRLNRGGVKGCIHPFADVLDFVTKQIKRRLKLRGCEKRSRRKDRIRGKGNKPPTEQFGGLEMEASQRGIYIKSGDKMSTSTP